MFPSLEIPAIAELAAVDAWVCWRSVMRKGKPTKAPFTAAGSPASSTDPRTWSSYAECFSACYVAGRHDGIGRVLVPDEGLVAIDLDGRTNPLPGIASYGELSPSGAGLHIWCRASWPTAGSKRAHVEVYSSKRFLTITGAHLTGTPEHILHADLRPLWEQHFAGRGDGAGGAPRAFNDALRQQLDLPLKAPESIDVHTIARRCPQLKRILARAYPSESERDLALVRFAKLAGRPAADAWALMVSVRTDGKAERPDYALRTIARIFAS